RLRMSLRRPSFNECRLHRDSFPLRRGSTVGTWRIAIYGMRQDLDMTVVTHLEHRLQRPGEGPTVRGVAGRHEIKGAEDAVPIPRRASGQLCFPPEFHPAGPRPRACTPGPRRAQ